MTRTLQELIQKSREYRTCETCVRHPNYPNIPAVTLHENGKCVICGSIEN